MKIDIEDQPNNEDLNDKESLQIMDTIINIEGVQGSVGDSIVREENIHYSHDKDT